jgi:pyruvate formate lyase activating enzyme
MKHICDEKHIEYTGVSNELILDNLIKLSQDPLTKDKLWLRMPLIEGLNDDMDTITKTLEFYIENGIKKVSFIPYHEMGISKATHIGRVEETFAPPSDEMLYEMKQLYESKGISVEIVGRDK